jgi:hypothetical protein
VGPVGYDCALGREQECRPPPPRASSWLPAGLRGVTCFWAGACWASFSPPTARKRCPTATLKVAVYC